MRPDIFLTSDPQNSANHAAEGGNPKVRGGVWRKVCAQPRSWLAQVKR